MSDAAARPAIAAVRKGNARGSGYEREELDWYVESREAVDALLDVERFIGLGLDPCCGAGNIPEALKARGLQCRASDLVDRGYAFSIPGIDARDIATRYTERNVAFVLTNPPFEHAEAVIEAAMQLVTHKVAILHRLAFLEGRERRKFHERHGLSRVWVFSNRQSMPPGGSDLKPQGGAVAFAWFVYEKGWRGPWQGGFLETSKPKRTSK